MEKIAVIAELLRIKNGALGPRWLTLIVINAVLHALATRAGDYSKALLWAVVRIAPSAAEASS